MTWIQPLLFWGLLGIAVPLLIHLWSGRKGKVMAWAATAWLNPQDSQSSKSLKIDHWLLLATRIALWTVLILLLVGLWLKWFSGVEDQGVTHLVVPSESLESEFRFELDQAVKNGETVLWLSEGLPVFEPENRSSISFDPDQIQSYLDQLESPEDTLHIYTSATSSEFIKASYWVPTTPIFHLGKESFTTVSSNLIQLDSGNFLAIAKDGLLEKVGQMSSGKVRLTSPVGIYFDQVEEEKKAPIQAALGAIGEVYSLGFVEVDSAKSNLVFTSGENTQSSDSKLYMATESMAKNALAEPVDMPWNEVLEKGVLPELILNNILSFYEIEGQDRQISLAQLSQKFQLTPKSKTAKMANTNEILLILIVLIFAFERYLAFKNNQ